MRTSGRLALAGLGTGALLLGTPVAAAAHPLGNFTVNHYLGLTLSPEAAQLLAVVDTAEIPTAQQRGALDRNGDGRLDPAEAAAHATTACADVRHEVQLEVGDQPVQLAVTASAFHYRPGAANLPTGRLECRLEGAVDLGPHARVVLRDLSGRERVGWHELTIVGRGVALERSPVPSRSVSDELRHYPNDLLSSPLDVRSAELTATPGAGSSTYGTFTAVRAPGALGRILGRADKRFGDLVGADHAGPAGVLLAALLALLLGAGHATLPGHGKTIMAAYLAGRRGSARDALAVGATVTITHTLGVLGLGLALSLSSSLAGDVVTRRLALVSGVIVVGVGLGLLRSALRGDPGGHRHGPGGHTHGPDSHRPDAHDHDHPHDHHHDHHHDHGHDHRATTARLEPVVDAGSGQGLAVLERPSSPAATADEAPAPPRRFSRAGLVGMGIAGGLVPSPSALVVLLSAIALGRAWLGIGLVVLYGIGMAGTLTGIGLLLVKAGDRVQRRFLAPGPTAARVLRAVPVVTACAVIAVGVLLSARAL